VPFFVGDVLHSCVSTADFAPRPQTGRLLLKIRDLYSFEKHANARSAYYECVTHVAQPVHEISMSVCDSRLICTLHFGSGLSKHLLLDWVSLKAMVILQLFSQAPLTDTLNSGSRSKMSCFCIHTSCLASKGLTRR